ncbi:MULTISPECIES: D-2-hydroxyacid dehydrogenase [Flavobacterium]|jgi:D-3-phosphoglycerate dehydrogenase|uniref:D-3-phosphoglycerate dehydrogenase n=1 Tax=Flavobacterium lindanitolerans TaxID=428988 RepID=A0A497TZ04_9FLAO|nr:MULTISPECIES: D-2-hydroxyacid dehydrogenase [Flavobacterium]PZQ90190.1 MAG: 3-phosphoglycerate dehydrogenase [Flavobacterium johnsoniae]KQS47706.1 3-phosphoglycerate dehydrogenase [Flavobacterium sp. Leaf359]MBC8645016.1 D-2-hydroxyacid dehydrogenase [Flavobacterium lindanitolerans]MBL7869081.1 D-2-hydroxyacid dehydrogenase [Flavobacterium lindanitolerans]OJX54505.1 MAG: 3-phosphoglycerate dehydrogenase [Flavobacterium sp. 38-13]
MKVLANDGISKSGIIALEKGGFEVITTKVAQEQVANYINKNAISVLLVRSATKVRQDIIDNCPTLKVIGRGGVGMDNIDVDYAREKGIHVINTPASSSESVAELVFAHLFSGVRFLHDANRNMPLEGDSNFEGLKKAYANGIELKGKTLGIIGFGKIGKAVAKIGLGLGMRVIASDKFVGNAEIKVDFYNGQFINVDIVTEPMEDILRHSDFISLHVPAQDGYVIGKEEFEQMKDGVGIINASRGGIINEVDLIEALDNGKVLFAGLDVFEEEPTPAVQVLMHPKISLTPHIGAATLEAQDRIGIELAEQIISLLKSDI